MANQQTTHGCFKYEISNHMEEQLFLCGGALECFAGRMLTVLDVFGHP